MRRLRQKRPDRLDLSSLRFLLNGAEPISANVCREFLTEFSEYGLSSSVMIPVYGLAEATLAVTFTPPDSPLRTMRVRQGGTAFGERVECVSQAEAGDSEFVDVGPVVNDCKIRLVDSQNRPLPEGYLGGIQISGKNVTRGYYGARQGVDAEDAWLDTGDLGFLNDGHLIVTGRAKEILFVNGQNYYPADLERAVAEAAGVEVEHVAVVGCRTTFAPDEEVPCAFVAFRGKPGRFAEVASAVRTSVGSRWGIEVRHVVPVARIPRTTSGKAQRVRLADEMRAGAYDAVLAEIEALAPPEILELPDDGTTLAVVVGVWQEVLGAEQVSGASHFFELGGDSMRAAQSTALTEERLGIVLKPECLAAHPVAADYARAVTAASNFLASSSTNAGNLDRECYPASLEQRALCALQYSAPEATSYNIPFGVNIEGPFRPGQFEAAMAEVIARHSALRTRFMLTGAELVQRIEKRVEFTLPVEDVPECELPSRLEHFVQPFALDQAPLFRAKVFRLGPERHVLACDGHHSVLDGLSMQLMFSEAAAEYGGKARRKGPHPQFAQLCLGRAKRLASARETAERYWETRFKDGVPPANLPADLPRTQVTLPGGDRVYFALDKGGTDCLRRLARAEGATLYTVLLAAYFVLLSRLSGEADLAVATPISGRTAAEEWRALGMFVRTALVRARVGGSFRTFLKEIDQAAKEAFDAAEYPLDEIAAAAESRGRRSLFDVMFVMQSLGVDRRVLPGATCTLLDYPVRSAKFELTLEAVDSGDTQPLRFGLEYSAGVFQRASAERFASYYTRLLRSIAADPDKPATELELMDDDERNRLVHAANQTRTEYPRHSTIHELFEAQVQKTPDATAVIHAGAGASLSYRELDSAADGLARQLEDAGVRRGDRVCVLLERSEELIVALLGVLKAGAAFVPVEPTSPMARLQAILADSQPAAVVASRDLRTRLGRIDVPVLEAGKRDAEGGRTIVQRDVGPSDLAYIIYTSGTTGPPKGVMVEHRSLVNYSFWASRRYWRGELLHTALHTSVAFDLTITSLFPPLVNGSAIVIFEPGDPLTTIEQALTDARAGIVKLTPAHLRFAREIREPIRTKRLVVGGENLETGLARLLVESNPELEIFNEYGPTEATVGCMIHRFDPDRDRRTSVPIGVPADNCRIYILDESRRPSPLTSAGEIYIGGECLARGYWRDEVLTARRFLPNPFVPGERIYRTGDLAARTADGTILYLGRTEAEQKIRGYRVSTDEVQSLLRKIPGVEDAVVSIEAAPDGQMNMVAYLVSRDELYASALRALLSERVASYMIPSAFYAVPSIPLTVNGKVDRIALTALGRRLEASSEYEEPLGEWESRVAEIWRKVLGVDRVGRHDNFFDLGGDSIKALLISSRAEQEGLCLDVRSILAAQTVAKAAMLCRTSGANSGGASPISDRLPTPMEEWFKEQDFEDPDAYCHSLALRFRNRAQTSFVHASIKHVLSRHDVFRHRWESGRFAPSELAPPDFFVDQRNVLSTDSESLRRAIEETAAGQRRGIDIGGGRLFEACVVRGKDEDYLVVTAHHLAVDGYSWRVLLDQISEAYECGLAGRILPESGGTASLSEFAAAAHAHANSAAAREQIGFWVKISGAGSGPGPAMADRKTLVLTFSESDSRGLLLASRLIYKMDAGVLILTAMLRALGGPGETKRLRVEMESHGRDVDGMDLSRTVGWLTSLYAVEVELPRATLNEQVKAVKQQLGRITDSGRGYGVLRYLARVPELQRGQADARFNYLGEFDDRDNATFRYGAGREAAPSLTGADNCGPAYQADCFFSGGRLTVMTGLPSSDDRFLRRFTAEIENLARYAGSLRGVQFTPSDFDTIAVEQAAIDRIMT